MISKLVLLALFKFEIADIKCSDRVAQFDKPFASVSEARVRFPAGVFGKKLGQLFHTTLPL